MRTAHANPLFSGDCSLREAVIAANADPATADTIELGARTYQLSQPGQNEHAAAKGDLDIVGPVEIVGAGMSQTTVDGGALDRVFAVRGCSDCTVVMSGFTITDGRGVDYHGGGITLSEQAKLRLISVAVTGNIASNNAGFGAGGGIASSGDLTLIRADVSQNTAESSGGGVIQLRGNLSLQSTTVDGNEAGRAGGGLILSGARAAILRSTVSRNTAGSDAGGIYSYDDVRMLTVESSTVSGNRGWVGGIATGGPTRILNSTVAGNTSVNGPGGPAANIEAGDEVQLRNSIIADPLGGGRNCREVGNIGNFASSGFNLDEDGSCALTRASDVNNVNPQLAPLWDNGGPTETQAVGYRSPAVDRGAVTTCPARDQRGITRPRDGDFDNAARCDIGAYEWVVPPNW